MCVGGESVNQEQHKGIAAQVIHLSQTDLHHLGGGGRGVEVWNMIYKHGSEDVVRN